MLTIAMSGANFTSVPGHRANKLEVAIFFYLVIDSIYKRQIHCVIAIVTS